MVLNTCALYGATTYANNWIGINLLIVVLSLMIVAVVYSIGRILPDRIRGKVTEATKSEITQAILSVIIIVILAGTAQVACSVSVSLGSRILISAGIPAAQASLSPFAYADYYVGNLAMHKGLALLSNIYSTVISYDIASSVYGFVGGFLSKFASDALSLGFAKGLFSVSISPSFDFSIVLRLFADQYLLIYAPTITMVVGALFLQYIALPILQYTAFVVILPIAIAMRSLSFTGITLRNTSNAVLAIAIASYIVYPMTVLFDSYVMYWIYSDANPSLLYLNAAYTLDELPINSFLNNPMNTQFGSAQSSVSFVMSALSGSNFISSLFNPFSIIPHTHAIINNIAELIFQGIVLFAVNVAITLGFAIGLTKALNSGIEGAGSFWSNM